MRNGLDQIRCFVGVDVSEARLDVCLLPGSERAEFSRDRRGIARLLGWLASQERLLLVVEAAAGWSGPNGGARAGRDRGRGGQPAADP